MNYNDFRDFVGILRLAYSGELAAAYAYRGHWRSVSEEKTRDGIRQIEEDEWHHRDLVGRMLATIGKKPSALREVRAFLIGRTLGILCRMTGWLAPMYAAGRLESKNVGEYERAARLAVRCGYCEFVECLLSMAEVEWDHEEYFRLCVLSHRWASRIPLWPQLAPRESIRQSFEEELTTAATSDFVSREFVYTGPRQ